MIEDKTASTARVDGRIYTSAALLMVMFASMAVLPTVLDEMVRRPFGLSNNDTSLFYQAGTLASVVLGLFAGLLSDRLGRRVPLIVVGMGLSGLCTILLPHIPRYEWLLGLRFVDSALGIMAITLLMTRGIDYSDAGNRSRTMGVLMVAIPAGYIVGPMLVLAIGEGNLGLLFGILGGSQVLGALVIAREWGRHEHVERLSPTVGEMVQVVANLPRTWLPMIFSMVDKFSFAAIVLLTPLVLAEASMGSMGTRGVSAVILAYFMAFALASPVAGRLVARWGARGTVIVASLLYGGAFVLMGSAGSLAAMVALMVACGILTAFQFVPNMTLLGELAGARNRATVMAVFNTLGSLALLTGFVVLGRMSDTSIGAAYRLTGYLEIGCGVVGLVVVGIALARKGSPTVKHRTGKAPEKLVAPAVNGRI
jgi:MFS family permease